VIRLAAALVAACALLSGLPAMAQTGTQTTPSGTALPAGTTSSPKTRHVVRHTAVVHHVPVVAPRHPGTPRHPAAPARPQLPRPQLPRPQLHRKELLKKAAARKAPAKVAVVAKPAPKKPLPPPLPPDVGSNTGLHLPRYAALKSDDVNMRSGPGERYPVEWTYKRRDLPVRIEREFDVWRLVEDMDGIKGWVHQATLTGRRSFVITGTDDRTMRAEASATSAAVAVLKPGVVGRIRACDATKDWCEVQVDDYRGWLPRGDFWGADAGEAITP
jgi:SH3-like domain-containing protein